MVVSCVISMAVITVSLIHVTCDEFTEPSISVTESGCLGGGGGLKGGTQDCFLMCHDDIFRKTESPGLMARVVVGFVNRADI